MGPGTRGGPAVCLVGLRCSGKTTAGRALAAALGWPFADLDEALARLWAAEAAAEGVPAAGALLAQLGEPAFRALEARALAELLDGPRPIVVATGGGCVETPECRERLAAVRTLWLRAPVEVLQARMAVDPAPRPALLGGGDPAAELLALAARREPLYAAVSAAAVDAAAAPEVVVAELVARCR